MLIQRRKKYMIDKLAFKIVDPKGEEWAKEFPREIKVVEIYINEVELVEILKPIEMPYAFIEEYPSLAGSYGHITPEKLYRNLTASSEEIELLCCGDCGESGCWSILVNVEYDDSYVYWRKFKHNHRNWEYDISYKFDKTEYQNALKQLCMRT